MCFDAGAHLGAYALPILRGAILLQNMKGPRIISAVPLGLVLVSSCGRCLAWAAGSPQLESIGTHLLVHSAQSSSATLEGQAAELWNKHLALEEDRPSAWLQHCLQVRLRGHI